MKLGRAFSDSISSYGKHGVLFDTPKSTWWFGRGRVLFFSTLLVVVFGVLLFRLFQLTVIMGHSYRVLADVNRTRELTIHAPRGILFDRTGKPLTKNIFEYRLFKPCENDEAKLCMSFIGESEGNTLREKGLPSSWFIEKDSRREYMYPESTAHITGYLGEVTEKELSDEYFVLRGYKSGDSIGRSGAEAVFEETLRGKNGKQMVETDATGKSIRILGTEQMIPGEDVTLSIDADLSTIVKDAFPAGEKGAVVVSKPSTGEILALFSSPSFSPNVFTSRLKENSEILSSLFTDERMPLFNRVIGGVYPPGSTFKIVTALGALEEGAITKSTMFEDTGEITIGQYKFPNWFYKQYGGKDGMVDVVKALKRSNDIFFYKAGEALGITKLGEWAKNVGIGSLYGIELPGETMGLMPNPSWKEKQFDSEADKIARNNEWYLGDTYHVSIGQGYLLTTPLQVNTWTNVIANNGKLCKPTIKKVQGDKEKKPHCTDLHVKKETIDLIIQGMNAACSPGGTGYPLFDFGIKRLTTDDGRVVATSSGTLVKIPIACKTGTAEYGDPKNKTHAWFTSFGPSSPEGEPEISVTVLLEGRGEGSDKAAPIAKKILEAWFSR